MARYLLAAVLLFCLSLQVRVHWDSELCLCLALYKGQAAFADMLRSQTNHIATAVEGVEQEGQG